MYHNLDLILGNYQNQLTRKREDADTDSILLINLTKYYKGYKLLSINKEEKCTNTSSNMQIKVRLNFWDK
jgi:hypothetical protein